MFDTEKLNWGPGGLLPAVVQDFYSKEVLTVAYMNAESLAATLQEKRTCFYSRSRQALWRKGETSGHVQHVVSVQTDCDADALVVNVVKDGPACHTGAESCFFQTLYADEAYRHASLQALYALIKSRREQMPAGSYTTYLFGKGREKILKKIGEECSEVIVAAMKPGNEETIFEIADLCYHVLVLMAECEITPAEVMQELARRQVVDKKVKQETMQ